MEKYNFQFDVSSLKAIASIIGNKWRCYGTPRAFSASSAAFDLYLVSDGAKVTVQSEVDWYQLAGAVDYAGNPEEDQIANLTAHLGAEQLIKAEDLGRTYVFHAGVLVKGITIIRDEINCTLNGKQMWLMQKDTGIIIQFESGVIAVTLDQTMTETIAITRAPSVEQLKIPEISTYWENRELGDDYQWSRKLIPIGEALLSAGEL